MNNNLRIDMLLDDLLKGNLDRHEAEHLLKQEAVPDIQSEIDLHRAAAAAIQRYSVLQQVQLVHKEYLVNIRNKEGKGTGKRLAKLVSLPPFKWLMRIAVILVVVIGGWFAYQFTTASSSKLYAEIYQPYSINTNRDGDNGETASHNMIEQFKDKNYLAIINTFVSLPSTNNREKFLAAYALHETGNYAQAINVLKLILKTNNETGNRLYNDEAEFYLGLSYLQMKNNTAALAYFKIISNNINHTFHERISNWTMIRLKWLE